MGDQDTADNVLFTDEDIQEIFGSDADTEEKEKDELKGEEKPASPAEGEKKTDSSQTPDKKEETVTQIVAKRIKEEKTSIQEQVAKEAGYESYADMIAKKQQKKFEEKGYDPDEAKKLFDEMYEDKKKSDPAFQKLQQFEQAEKVKFATLQVEELNKSVGTKFKSIEEVPAEVVELWSTMKQPNLKQAYYALKGEEIAKNRTIQTAKEVEKQSEGHLQSVAGGKSGQDTKLRPVNRDEMDVIRAFHPELSDEEIKKRLTK